MGQKKPFLFSSQTLIQIQPIKSISEIKNLLQFDGERKTLIIKFVYKVRSLGKPWNLKNSRVEREVKFIIVEIGLMPSARVSLSFQRRSEKANLLWRLTAANRNVSQQKLFPCWSRSWQLSIACSIDCSVVRFERRKFLSSFVSLITEKSSTQECHWTLREKYLASTKIA